MANGEHKACPFMSGRVGPTECWETQCALWCASPPGCSIRVQATSGVTTDGWGEGTNSFLAHIEDRLKTIEQSIKALQPLVRKSVTKKGGAPGGQQEQRVETREGR